MGALLLALAKTIYYSIWKSKIGWENEKINHVNRASKSSNLKEVVVGIDRSAKTGSSLQAA